MTPSFTSGTTFCHNTCLDNFLWFFLAKYQCPSDIYWLLHYKQTAITFTYLWPPRKIKTASAWINQTYMANVQLSNYYTLANMVSLSIYDNHTSQIHVQLHTQNQIVWPPWKDESNQHVSLFLLATYWKHSPDNFRI